MEMEQHKGQREDQRDRGFPAFFAQAPKLTVRDPLAQFLGAAQQGTIEYRYADAVRLAGHSCPTVAGAYLMVLHGLRALYGSDLPVRGEVAVALRDAQDRGVNGVVASVVQLLTGAAAASGFQGMGAGRRFSRQHLMAFEQPIEAVLGLVRKDTGRAVQVQFHEARVPWDEEARALMPRAVAGKASAAELERFGQLWQERVRKILVDHANDPQLVQVSDWQPA